MSTKELKKFQRGEREKQKQQRQEDDDKKIQFEDIQEYKEIVKKAQANEYGQRNKMHKSYMYEQLIPEEKAKS